jgi:hypothetical protein
VVAVPVSRQLRRLASISPPGLRCPPAGCPDNDYDGGCLARACFGQLHAGDPGCIFNARHWEKLVANDTAVAGDPATPADQTVLTPTRCGPG